MPQGAPSSPVYFNIYIEDLAETAQRWIGSVADNKGALVLVADDVLEQATSNRRLQRLLDAASTWVKEKYAQWSVEKCSYLMGEGTDGKRMTRLDGKDLRKARTETYL